MRQAIASRYLTVMEDIGRLGCLPDGNALRVEKNNQAVRLSCEQHRNTTL